MPAALANPRRLKEKRLGWRRGASRMLFYDYDNDGLLTSAQTAAGTLSLTYNPQNGLLTGTVIGRVNDQWTYNAFAEPSDYRANIDASAVFAQNFTRDALGRIVIKTETIGGTTTTYGYSYDPAGRLATVDTNGVQTASYTYDLNGNRLSADVAAMGTRPASNASGTYDAQDRMTAYGACSYQYAANGELTTRTCPGAITRYTYDVHGNLTAAHLPDGRAIEYIVDGNGRRVGKKIDGVKVQGLIYADQLEPIAEQDGNGNIVSTFVYADRMHVPNFMQKGGATYRIVSDHLGSVRLVIDIATGATAQRIDYDEWGITVLDTAPGFQPFGYAGGIYDRDTGITRYGWRDYEPVVGRWTSKDLIGFGGNDTNFYAYVGGDPVSFIDPSGLGPEDHFTSYAAAEADARQYISDLRKSKTLWDRINDTSDLYVYQVTRASRCIWTYEIGEIQPAMGMAPAPGFGRLAGITGYTRHGLNQAISRDGVGVSSRAILDAIRNPLKSRLRPDGTMQYTGANATVAMNAWGQIVTLWARSSAGWRAP